MTEATGAVMVLGDGARDTAPAHRISQDAPGTGYALTESGALQRVRAAYVTDDQIRYLAANFLAPTSTVLDSIGQDGTVLDETVPEGNVTPLRDPEGSGISRSANAQRSSRSPRKPRAARAPRMPRGSRSDSTGSEATA